MIEKYIKPIKEYLDNILDTLKLELNKELDNLFKNLEI